MLCKEAGKLAQGRFGCVLNILSIIVYSQAPFKIRETVASKQGNAVRCRALTAQKEEDYDRRRGSSSWIQGATSADTGRWQEVSTWTGGGVSNRTGMETASGSSSSSMAFASESTTFRRIKHL